MNRIPALVGGLLYGLVGLAAAAATDGQWSVEAGAAQVAVDGIRTYNVPSRKLAQNDRDRVPAGFVRVACDLGDAWTVGLSYTHYGQLRASGYSPTTDIFDRSQVGLTMIVPLRMTERIQEWSLDGRRRWQLSPRWSVAAGPMVSYFHSSAELGSWYVSGTIGSPVVQRVDYPIADYHANDLRLGGVVDTRFSLSSRWSVAVGYRFAAPPSRKLHLSSVSFCCRL